MTVRTLSKETAAWKTPCRLMCGVCGWVGTTCTHLVFQSLEPLSPPPLSPLVPPLQRVLRQRVSLEGAVPPRHAQGGAAAPRHAGEALAAREAEHGDLVEAHGAPGAGQPGSLQDGPDCSRGKETKKHRGK